MAEAFKTKKRGSRHTFCSHSHDVHHILHTHHYAISYQIARRYSMLHIYVLVYYLLSALLQLVCIAQISMCYTILHIYILVGLVHYLIYLKCNAFVSLNDFTTNFFRRPYRKYLVSRRWTRELLDLRLTGHSGLSIAARLQTLLRRELSE